MWDCGCLIVLLVCPFLLHKKIPILAKQWFWDIKWFFGYICIDASWVAQERSLVGYSPWSPRVGHAAAAKSLQSCLTLCDPIDSSPPGSPVPGILQARTLEWVAISFSNAWKWKVRVKSLSRVWLLAIPWTTAYQAPLSMGFSRQDLTTKQLLP